MITDEETRRGYEKKEKDFINTNIAMLEKLYSAVHDERGGFREVVANALWQEVEK